MARNEHLATFESLESASWFTNVVRTTPGKCKYPSDIPRVCRCLLINLLPDVAILSIY